MKATLTEQVYHELNAKISEALGYKIGEATEIYTNPQPEVVDGMCEMEITWEVIEKCSDLLTLYNIEYETKQLFIEQNEREF